MLYLSRSFMDEKSDSLLFENFRVDVQVPPGSDRFLLQSIQVLFYSDPR
jgi:hypothetical protein